METYNSQIVINIETTSENDMGVSAEFLPDPEIKKIKNSPHLVRLMAVKSIIDSQLNLEKLQIDMQAAVNHADAIFLIGQTFNEEANDKLEQE